MDEVCIEWVWTGSCVNGRLRLVSKKFGGEFFSIDVFYFIKRVLLDYFGDYFSERFDAL